jgi:hypothetical protein
MDLRTPALIVLGIVGTATLGCSSESSDSPEQSGEANLTQAKTADIKDAAKKALKKVDKFDNEGDDKKAFDSVAFKDLTGKKGAIEKSGKKACWQVRAKASKNVTVRAVGGDALDAVQAVHFICGKVNILGSASCGADGDLEIRLYDGSKKDPSDACDTSTTYVGAQGDNADGEKSLNGHHHYNQMKGDGTLKIGDSEDQLSDT